MKTIIPNWNAHGVLPPIAPGVPGNSKNRSPYRVDLTEFVSRFSDSDKRITILDGFLRFRGELHKLGLVSGFQWIDGSFLENIEDLEYRYPNDLDVVTFYIIPEGESQKTLLNASGGVFDRSHLKTKYSIDGYFIQAYHPDYVADVRETAYWYSMWGHRRDGLWKGFIQIDLDKTYDDEAMEILNDKKGGVQ